MSWLYLSLAIAFEIAGTMALRVSEGLRDKRWAPAVIGGYTISFALLALSLRAGMPLGVAYGIWAAVGIALTAIIGRMAFRDPLTRTMGSGIALISVGVLLVEMGATAHAG